MSCAGTWRLVTETARALFWIMATKNDESSRAVYLERENARLQRLVAELLVKNEQLRQLYLASLASSTRVTDFEEISAGGS